MSINETLSARKQLLITIGLTLGAFLVALPVGAHVMPRTTSAVSPTAITRTVTETAGLDSCSEGTGHSAAQAASTHTVRTVATSATHTNTSTNNGGATAQVGRDGIATAVNVGDVLSNNDVSVPVLSNNTTTVAPVTTVSPSVNLLNNNTGNGVLGLGVLGIL